MIDFYSGTPGSGKSLHVAEKIYWKIRNGGCVVCNFAINTDIFKVFDKKKKLKKNYMRGTCIQIENINLDPIFLMNYSRAFFKRNKKNQIIEGQALLVIDECQLMFNSRSWNSYGRSEWVRFFTQHRKFGYNVILVSQFDRLVDRQIRSLIENEYVHRKMNNYKLYGKIMGLLFGGSAFVAIKYWYPMRTKKDGKLGAEYFGARKRYIEFYNSYKIF